MILIYYNEDRMGIHAPTSRYIFPTRVLVFALCQEVLKDFCEDAAFLADRRRVLRIKAGLKESEKHKVQPRDYQNRSSLVQITYCQFANCINCNLMFTISIINTNWWEYVWVVMSL